VKKKRLSLRGGEDNPVPWRRVLTSSHKTSPVESSNSTVALVAWYYASKTLKFYSSSSLYLCVCVLNRLMLILWFG
jgi:hypothetical protein